MVTRAHETGTRNPFPDVDLSSFPTGDGKPVAENLANLLQMVGLQYGVRGLLAMQGRFDAAVGGNQFLYYNPRNKRENLSPDAYVALDVPPGGRQVWFTWVEGKAPDIVFEITSPTTRKNDIGTGPRGKRTLYAALGVREYYVYDPAGAMRPRLRGYALRQDTLVDVPLLPTGGVWSPLLRAELRPTHVPGTQWEPEGTYLRVIDPATDEPIHVGEEVEQDYRAARQQLTMAERQLTMAERQLTMAERQLGAAQERLVREEQARLAEQQARLAEQQARIAAEQRARAAEEALQRLLSAQDLNRPDQPQPSVVDSE